MSKFLESMEKEDICLAVVLDHFYKEVISFNRMIGLDIQEMTEDQVEQMINSYFKLRIEESSEIFESIEKEDRVEFLDGVVDTLVVAGFEYYLRTFEVFSQACYGYSIAPFIKYLKLSYDINSEAACQDTLEYAQNIFRQMDVDHRGALQEVLTSNFSKIPTMSELRAKLRARESVYQHINDEQVLELQAHIIELEGRYSGITWKECVSDSGEVRYSFWCTHEYGKPKVKYVKPLTFVEPDLSLYFNRSIKK